MPTIRFGLPFETTHVGCFLVGAHVAMRKVRISQRRRALNTGEMCGAPRVAVTASDNEGLPEEKAQASTEAA